MQGLQELEAADVAPLGREAAFGEWRSKSLTLLRAAFGAGGEQVGEFQRAVFVKNEGWQLSGGGSRTVEAWRVEAVHRGRGVLRASIFALETISGDSLLDDASIDPDLWAHVQGLVAADDWAKVPASVAIFLEDKVRRWAGDPRTSRGEVMIGTALYGHALASDGPLHLGGQSGERDGWRFLGQGLAQALGNVDRHRIQRRDDVKRYAMGVLGLDSLLLTQLRYEHPAQIQEAESLAETADEDDGAASSA